MKNKEQENIQKELEPFLSELTELAKFVAEEFKENPTDISGSTIQIHEESPYMDERIVGTGWKRVLKNIPFVTPKKNEKK